MLLQTAMSKSKKLKKKMKIGFVDLSKVYDRVSREALFEKLSSLGFGGTCLRIFKNMYSNDSLQFMVNGEQTRKLYLKLGLKQGCNLSPLCFNLMMTEMAMAIHAARVGIEIDGENISGIMFADDICLIALTLEGMQILMKIVREYGAQFNMVMNLDKTKWLECSGGEESEELVVNETLIQQVNEYKYLGVIISSDVRSVFNRKFGGGIILMQNICSCYFLLGKNL